MHYKDQQPKIFINNQAMNLSQGYKTERIQIKYKSNSFYDNLNRAPSYQSNPKIKPEFKDNLFQQKQQKNIIFPQYKVQRCLGPPLQINYPPQNLSKTKESSLHEYSISNSLKSPMIRPTYALQSPIIKQMSISSNKQQQQFSGNFSLTNSRQQIFSTKDNNKKIVQMDLNDEKCHQQLKRIKNELQDNKAYLKQIQENLIKENILRLQNQSKLSAQIIITRQRQQQISKKSQHMKKLQLKILQQMEQNQSLKRQLKNSNQQILLLEEQTTNFQQNMNVLKEQIKQIMKEKQSNKNGNRLEIIQEIDSKSVSIADNTQQQDTVKSISPNKVINKYLRNISNALSIDLDLRSQSNEQLYSQIIHFINGYKLTMVLQQYREILDVFGVDLRKNNHHQILLSEINNFRNAIKAAVHNLRQYKRQQNRAVNNLRQYKRQQNRTVVEYCDSNLQNFNSSTSLGLKIQSNEKLQQEGTIQKTISTIGSTS